MTGVLLLIKLPQPVPLRLVLLFLELDLTSFPLALVTLVPLLVLLRALLLRVAASAAPCLRLTLGIPGFGTLPPAASSPVSSFPAMAYLSSPASCSETKRAEAQSERNEARE